jgi:glutamyl-tRNA synthetase
MADTTNRVRFAPSPTGYLHIGGARTALFNWLFVRKTGGVFVLRIEDTDVERSSEDMVTGILDGLGWLGLDWDEGPGVDGPYGPYFQSQRLKRYREAGEALVSSGHAYYCYCTPETLKEKRQRAEAAGGGWMYDRTCLALEPERVRALEEAGTPRAIRFEVPEGRTVFDDLVKGRIEFDHSVLEDFVVLRSDFHPTYHLSVVVDDIDMAISHVVRGDDHVSNTPKQVLLYEAFGKPMPRFAHVPLILGSDRRRLSKRHGATSVTEYARQGFLPEAMVNFLVLLGWSPGDDRELFDRDELVEAFSLEAISSSNAVFNPEKLVWFNSQHIARLSPPALVERLRPVFEKAGVWRPEYEASQREWFEQVIALLQPRAKKLDDFVEAGRPFLRDAVEYDEAAVRRHLSAPGLGEHLSALKQAFAGTADFSPGELEAVLRRHAELGGVKAAVLIHATRVAVTGQAVSPGLFEVISLLGRKRTIERLEAAERLLGAG